MGMFDVVNVPCPTCGEVRQFQSKGGDRLLDVYELHNCPLDVLSGVNRHAPQKCSNCGTLFAVQVSGEVKSVVFHGVSN